MRKRCSDLNRQGGIGVAVLSLVLMAGVAFSQAPGGYPELPPYTPPVGSLAGASGARLWELAQQRYQANDHRGAAVLTRQAAMAGSPIATYEMGYMYETGDGVPLRLDAAVEWYKRGAAKGSRECEDALGAYYEQGGAGHPEDFGAALRYYREASAAGDANATYDVARIYEYGLGVPLDLRAAALWYDTAAHQGHPKAADRARNLLGLYLTFDDTFAGDRERDLYTDEGPWLAPAGHVFHSYAERMQYLQTHHGVKKDPQTRAVLLALDRKQLEEIQKEQAEEYVRTHPPLTDEQQEQMRRTNSLYTGMRLWQAANPGMRSPGVPR
jgi:TPR repeat protein